MKRKGREKSRRVPYCRHGIGEVLVVLVVVAAAMAVDAVAEDVDGI
jgi:hypothetical protein